MSEQQLKPANENPWYIMMILYGEQEGERVDRALAEKNRKLWNAWVCQGMADEARIAAAKSSRIDASETEYSEEIAEKIRVLFAQEWQKRNGSDVSQPMPEPTQSIRLSRTKYHNSVHFEQMIFGDIAFVKSRFLREATFLGATFSQQANFFTTEFDGGVKFEKSIFLGQAVFVNTVFKGMAGFKEAEFFRPAFFVNAHFLGGSNFEKASFEESVNFNPSNFDGPTDFKNAQFGQSAVFSSASFAEDVTFIEASFKSSGEFVRATFGALADFRDADFGGLADFRGRESDPGNHAAAAHFGTQTLFSGAHFHKRADFFRRRFGPYDKPAETLTFANAIFDGPVSFEEAVFPDLMPVLTNTVLPESTKVTARNENWPRLRPDPVGKLIRYLRNGPENFATQSPEIVKASAASLRHAMARQMLPEEEHFFFRREMWGAERTWDLLRRIPVRVFGAVSNFGYSIGRPTALLFLLWTTGWIVYAHQTEFGVIKSAAYSFATMFKFFGLQGTYLSTEAEGLSAGLQLWSGTQTVLAFILLFFLGLGLRTRFRLR